MQYYLFRFQETFSCYLLYSHSFNVNLIQSYNQSFLFQKQKGFQITLSITWNVNVLSYWQWN